jgi:hypothetical protein
MVPVRGSRTVGRYGGALLSEFVRTNKKLSPAGLFFCAIASHVEGVLRWPIVLALALTRAWEARAELLQGQATVIDGDTIEIHGQRIRLHGIDAPEGRQLCQADGAQYRCGQRAAFALADHITAGYGFEVGLHPDRKHDSGRCRGVERASEDGGCLRLSGSPDQCRRARRR